MTQHISMNVRFRMKVEELLVKQVVRDLLDAGYLLGVDDGEEISIHHSRNYDAITAKLFTTDQDYIYVYVAGDDRKDLRPQYWVRCTYGNDGIDVLSDYSTHLEPQIKTATEIADKLERGEFTLQVTPTPVAA
jgi:hypothetical protein